MAPGRCLAHGSRTPSPRSASVVERGVLGRFSLWIAERPAQRIEWKLSHLELEPAGEVVSVPSSRRQR